MCTVGRNFGGRELVAVAIVALNPYFLECLSYKFDAPYIAVAILAMIIPLLFRKKEGRMVCLIVMMGTLVTCTTYQSGIRSFADVGNACDGANVGSGRSQ